MDRRAYTEVNYISVLYTDYLASKEEKTVIKNKEKMLENKKKEILSNIEIKEIFPKVQDPNGKLK